MPEPEPFDQFVMTVARESWALFKREALLFVLAAALLALVSVLSLGLLAGPVTIGFIEMVRRGRRGEPLAMSMLFDRFDTFVPSLVALVLIAISASIGMALLVVPGLLVLLFVTYTFHVIAYEASTGITAMQRSFDLVKGYFLHTLALLLAISVAHAIGGAVVFGVLITAPLSLIALTLGFERLLAMSTPPAITG